MADINGTKLDDFLTQKEVAEVITASNAALDERRAYHPPDVLFLRRGLPIHCGSGFSFYGGQGG